MRKIAVFPVLLIALGLRFVWEAHASLFFCCLFWGTISIFIILGGYIWQVPGFACNAAVTIANNGHMPSTGEGPHIGIYVQATSDTALPMLCDRYLGGASIGDFLVLAGMLTVFAMIGLRYLRQQKTRVAF